MASLRSWCCAFLQGNIRVCQRMLTRLDALSHHGVRYAHSDADSTVHALWTTLLYGGVEFEESRELGATLRGGSTLTQTDAILRYVSRMARTYSRDAETAAIIDEWTAALADMMRVVEMHVRPEQYGLVGAFDAVKHRAYIVETHLPKHLQLLEDELCRELYDAEDPVWLGGLDSPSMADISWCAALRWLCSSCFAPEMRKLLESRPCISEFMDCVSAHCEWDQCETAHKKFT